MLVLVDSKIPTPVAPMLFTSQLTLSFLVTGCCLGMFPGVSSEWLAEGLSHFRGCGWGTPWSRFAETGNREGVASPARSWVQSDQAVRLGTTEGTPGNHFHFQITHNSLMGWIHSHEAKTSGDTPGTSKNEVKKLLVELVDSCKKSAKEKCSLQFLQKLGENCRFNLFLSEGDIVDKASMLTISPSISNNQKIQAILGP